MEALCPLCGAKSNWRGQPDTELWRKRIPDDCHFCKAEDGLHWQVWWQGIDVTEAGGNIPLGRFHSPDVLENGARAIIDPFECG